MSGAPTSTVPEYSFDFFSELFGSLNEAPEADQPKILKAYLLRGVDTMREHTIRQLDLLEKLGSLALDNVQDVRLYSLEARIKELEAGKPLTFGAVVTELFFAIALEATLLTGITMAGPMVAGAAALVVSNIRSSARSPNATRRLAAIARLETHRSELVGWELRLLNRLHTRQTMNTRKGRMKMRRDKAVTAEELQSVRHAMEYYNRKYEFMIDAERIRASTQFKVNYQSMMTIRFNKKIEALMHQYAHHVDGGKSAIRSFAVAARSTYPYAFPSEQQAPAAQAPYEHFTTGHSVAQLIAQCESMKLDVDLHYGQMREIVALIEPDEIFSAFETLLVMEELEHNLFDTMELTEDMIAHLEDFVVPMELAIWLTYLESNGALEREQSATRREAAGQYFRTSPRFFGDDFIEALISNSPSHRDTKRTVYMGRRYTGLRVLDEHHAYYLFYKFAKPAFETFSNRIPVSKIKDLGDFIHKDVRADAFKDVLAMPKSSFWDGENKERAVLIKEMGVVVIEYFIQLRERLLEKETVGFSDSVPAGTRIATLFGQIERPTLANVVYADDPAAVTPQQVLDQQQLAFAMEWEVAMLSELDEREHGYDLALSEYQIALNVRESIGNSLPQGFMDSYVMDQARGRLMSARALLEQSIGLVIYDEQQRTSDVLEAKLDELQRKLMSCPVESEMFERLPR